MTNETNRKDKARFSAWITKETYNRVNEVVRNNEIITARLVPGTVLEIGLNIFFAEIDKGRTVEELAAEYLTDARRD